MRIEIEQHHLQTLLASVIGAVKGRNTIPILGNVKLTATDTMQAEATDLDIAVTAKQPAQVTTQGSTTVNAQMLYGIVQKLPKGSLVSIDDDGQFLHIKTGRSKFKLATLPVEDFPVMADDEYKSTLYLNGHDLKTALEKTSWAASSDETRYYLNGVAMQYRNGYCCLVATDGHRLAWFDGLEAVEFPDVIIPTVAVKQFISAISCDDVVLYVSETKIKLTADDTVIVSKVIDGTFPDWTRVIPKENSNYVTISSMDAKAAIERVSIVASERTKSVKVNVSSGELSLCVSDSTGSTATEVINGIQEGDDVEIGLNGKYALDAFAQAEKGDVTINYNGGSDPLIVKYDKEPNLTAVVMPMRV